MSVYNDYMTKVSVYFVGLAEYYCKLIAQGVDDCKIKNTLILLSMYLDTIPRCGNENCLTDEQLLAITNHINKLTGHLDWGTLTSINVINPPIAISPASSATVTPQAWSVIAGTAPVTITFNQPLGVDGDSWAMTYTAINSDDEIVFAKSITDRTANGFTVDFYEDNVTFEGVAVLKTS